MQDETEVILTDRKRAEAQVGHARDAAEQANRAKSEFLSRMSHELRTPLNAIIGFGQLLRMEPLEPSVGSSVDQVLDAAQHLLRLVNEVLDLSWIEAGAPGIALVAVSAATPLQESLQLVRPLASERGTELTSDLHGALHRYVLADPQRLKQVFLNLLSNAIKYNRPHGVIRVRCREDGGSLRFLVTDTGVGIDEQDVARLFAPFARLSPLDGHTEGSGLGLAVSRRLIEEMGGQIGVLHTAPGEGSTFYVELPLIEAPDEPPELPSGVAAALGTAPGPTGTVLYIEDTPANVELVARILDRMGGIKLLTTARGPARCAGNGYFWLWVQTPPSRIRPGRSSIRQNNPSPTRDLLVENESPLVIRRSRRIGLEPGDEILDLLTNRQKHRSRDGPLTEPFGLVHAHCVSGISVTRR